VLQAFGTVDILVNNAGLNIKDRSVSEMTPERWEQPSFVPTWTAPFI